MVLGSLEEPEPSASQSAQSAPRRGCHVVANDLNPAAAAAAKENARRSAWGRDRPPFTLRFSPVDFSPLFNEYTQIHSIRLHFFPGGRVPRVPRSKKESPEDGGPSDGRAAAAPQRPPWKLGRPRARLSQGRIRLSVFQFQKGPLPLEIKWLRLRQLPP